MVPNAPINLSNNPSVTSATKVGLTWNAGTNNGGTAIIDYTINYSTTSNGIFDLLVSNLTTTSYATTIPLIKGATYYFQVLARNSVGLSAPSSTTAVLVA